PLLAALLWIFGASYVNADCTVTNTGKIPLPEFGYGLYQGFAGGLYPNGGNNRPPSHLAARMEISTNQIQPLDANRQVNTNSGKIVLLSIGMSNTTDEWAVGGAGSFTNIANADPAKNPRLTIVDGAQGGEASTDWTNINSITWSTIVSRLAAANAKTNQVQ